MASLITKNKASIPRRLHLLFLIIVLLFVGLILRLAYMQIYTTSFYVSKLKSSTVYKVKVAQPRGKIFDFSGKPLVSNAIKDVVTYTRSPKASANELKVLAKHLASYVSYPEASVTSRAKKDFYLADPDVYANIVKRLPKKAVLDRFGNRLTEATIYANAVASVKESDLHYSDEDLKTIAIFNQMNGAAVFTTVNLRTNPLNEEIIKNIRANQTTLPGIAIGTDWERQVANTSLTALIGKVSSEEAGLPKEEVNQYLKKGYAMNDRVGTSYLEKQYESVLQGNHVIKEIKTNKTGKILSEQQLDKGRPGKNIKLTIPLDYQQGVDDIIRRYYEAEVASGQADYSEGIYAVALNPKTGAVLAMSGLSHNKETGQVDSDALGTITDVFTWFCC